MTDVRTEQAPTTTTATREPNPTGDFIWYELITSDPDASGSFYEAVVGWKIQQGAPEYGGYRMIGRSDGKFAGGVLPMTDEMQQHGAKSGWLGYIYVGDVDKAVASIEGAGGKTWRPGFDIPNVGRIAVVSDPQAAPFCIMKPIPPADNPEAKSDVFDPRAVQRCGWNELATTDEKAARQFYAEQFGWTSEDFMPMGEMGEYRFLKQNGQVIGAAFNTPDGRPRWRFYFRVPSISAAKETIEKSGGKITMGPTEVPGGDHIIAGFDPQGAEFALVGGA